MLPLLAFGQKVEPIVFAAKVVDGEVYLRWVVSNSVLLDHGQKHGFTLTKIWTKDQQQFYKSDTLFLKNLIEWERKDSEEYGFNASKAIYQGEDESLLDLPLIEKLSARRNLFFMKLLMADMSAESAYYQGLGLHDSSIEKGVQYHYTLRINHVDSLDKNYTLTIGMEDEYVYPEITDLKGQGNDLQARISWNNTLYEADYNAFNIEKSSDNGEHFEQLNEAPFVPMTSVEMEDEAELTQYKDSLAQNGIEYQYRIYGLDAFGQKGPYSKTIKIIGRPNPIDAPPAIREVFETSAGVFSIKWHFNDDFKDKIKNFYVLRSIDGRKTYQRISPMLSVESRNFLDESPSTVNYYKIIVIDENDYHVSSIANLGQLNDITPPAPPIGLIGNIDSSGLVSLSWSRNNEPDLDGYHVFYCNVKNGEYSILSRKSVVRDSSFSDTIYVKTLARKIFYKIYAIDFRGNQSDYSEILELKRPDVFPPTPAVFKSRKSALDQIYFSWTNSSSWDLASNALQRRYIGEIEWITIHENQEIGTTVSYIDSTISCDKLSMYRVLSTDEDGLMSISDTLKIKCIDSGKRIAIEDLDAIWNKEQKQIVISWSYKTNVPVKSIMIFRKEKKGKMMKIKQFWKKDIDFESQFSYIDKAYQDGKGYQYSVVMRFEDNGFAKSNKTNMIKTK